MSKRQDYINWDELFMGFALLAAKRSKDPSTQVGACVVSPDNNDIHIGYNGFPQGCSDDDFPWDKGNENELDNKYLYVVHAELNAVLKSNNSLEDHIIYVTLFPCNECAKAIIQKRVKKVIYLSDKNKDSCSVEASKAMLKSSGVLVERFKSDREGIYLDFDIPHN